MTDSKAISYHPIKLCLVLASLFLALSPLLRADNYSIYWGTAPDGKTPLYLNASGDLQSPEACAFVNGGYYYEGYLLLNGRGELWAYQINPANSPTRWLYRIVNSHFELKPSKVITPVSKLFYADI